MISFDLKCAQGHVFEVWFRSSADYDRQNATGLVTCPVCGNAQIGKAVMAPAIGAKSNRQVQPPAASTPPMGVSNGAIDEGRLKAMVDALAQAQTEMLKTSQWVGDRFVEKVRAMHYGETEHALVHGSAKPEEVREMVEEGLPVAPLIVPVAPPDETH